MTTTRAEHLAWCKQRAHAELEGSEDSNALSNAWNSIASDLTKHPETTDHVAIELGTMLRAAGQLKTKIEMANFIDGIN
tara:strand:- start:454 stop:690 length:237 start_codon:yes stop_codon:yes gene_type:complete